MPIIPSYRVWRCLVAASVIVCFVLVASSSFAQSANRTTPLVKAVAKIRPSVVNIRGRKTVRNSDNAAKVSHPLKQVNGMGTGVVIDHRGYVLTNYHVVEDVSQINVTTAGGETLIGRLLAHDEETDLAIIKIQARQPLKPVNLGTSTNLILAETVAAVGNAYGYEHTVTVGVISELGRTVQVSDDQIYYNLIQTDASINPGNSGGPLLNMDGEMIGINVAVRVGAQGIAFAIPVNAAMNVATTLMNQIIVKDVYHGATLKTEFINHEPVTIIDDVRPGSPAMQAGLRKGDQVTSVENLACKRAIDFQTSLLNKSQGDTVEVIVSRQGSRESIELTLAAANAKSNNAAWDSLGIRVVPVASGTMKRLNSNYQSGLRIVQVRTGSSAERENIRVNDILVAMHGWKTESVENLTYILRQPEARGDKPMKFYIFRGRDPLYGMIRVARKSD